MIAIQVDEKACVGCSLCVDVCPTKVFRFDEARELAVTDKPAECFGCLSCSEICPSDAIEHQGVTPSETFHHDPYALRMAARIEPRTAGAWREISDPEVLARTGRDLEVRLRSVGAVFLQTIGQGLPAVGTLAGRTLAGQLPRYQVPADLSEALDLARERFAPAWELEPHLEGDRLTVKIAGCAVRDLCRRDGLALGGELCILFGNYLCGFLVRMGQSRLRFTEAQRDMAGCSYTFKVYAR